MENSRPSSNTYGQPDKAGYLFTLTGSTFLGKEKWKKRYYVLTGSDLHRFKTLEDAIAERQSEKKIALDKYDICQRFEPKASTKDFVFLLDGAVGNVQQPRYVFAAESNDEMTEWVFQLRRTLLRLQQNKTNSKPKRPPRSKGASSSTSSSAEPPKSECHDVSGNAGDSSSSRLYNPTKLRVRGPKGRRLPQKKNRLKDDGDKYRSNSLCEFDISDSNDDNQTEGKDGVDGGRKNGEAGHREKNKLKSNSSDNLAYRYSSSEDSLDVWNNDGLSKTTTITTTTTEDKSKVEEPKSPKDTVVQIDVVTTTGGGGGGGQSPPKSPQTPGGTGNATGPLIFTSAKLLEVNANLKRMKKQMTDDVTGVSSNLMVIKKKLLDIPEDYTLAETVTAQATLAMMDLKAAEDDVKTLTTLVSNIEKSLDLAQQRCENILKELSSG